MPTPSQKQAAPRRRRKKAKSKAKKRRKSKKTPDNRESDGTFKKGHSGNPAGRPTKDLQALARCKELTPMVLNKFEEILGADTHYSVEYTEDGAFTIPPAVRTQDQIQVGKTILAYAEGLPRSTHDINVSRLGAVPDSELKPLVVQAMHYLISKHPQLLAMLGPAAVDAIPGVAEVVETETDEHGA